MSPTLTASLRRIESLTTKLADLQAQRELAISKAIAGGATWREVAGSLGCSPQAAHRRYRWLAHNDKTGEVWYQEPLPL
jgi:hypothetical protein